MNELQNTLDWFKQAIPEPTTEQACIQIGCHYEEVAEMMHAIGDGERATGIDVLSSEYKECHKNHYNFIEPGSMGCEEEFLDSLTDQIVTAIGVCHMMGFDIEGALAEVNRSNFSKFEDGKPVFDVNGKITKGKDYTPPNLTGMIGK